MSKDLELEIKALRAALAVLQQQLADKRTDRWHLTYNASLTGYRASPAVEGMGPPGCMTPPDSMRENAVVDADALHGTVYLESADEALALRTQLWSVLDLDFGTADEDVLIAVRRLVSLELVKA